MCVCVCVITYKGNEAVADRGQGWNHTTTTVMVGVGRLVILCAFIVIAITALDRYLFTRVHFLLYTFVLLYTSIVSPGDSGIGSLNSSEIPLHLSRSWAPLLDDIVRLVDL